jgi:hypothetical protein
MVLRMRTASAAPATPAAMPKSRSSLVFSLKTRLTLWKADSLALLEAFSLLMEASVESSSPFARWTASRMILMLSSIHSSRPHLEQFFCDAVQVCLLALRFVRLELAGPHKGFFGLLVMGQSLLVHDGTDGYSHNAEHPQVALRLFLRDAQHRVTMEQSELVEGVVWNLRRVVPVRHKELEDFC